jgi:hypothetical protein
MAVASDRWSVAQRIEGWAGETRVNLIRIAAILAFYGYHCLNHYFFRDKSFATVDDETLSVNYHTAVTSLVLIWCCIALAVYLCLANRYVPEWLKFATTASDTVMVTGLVIISGGPLHPLTVLFFLIIAAAPLRLSLQLVYVATFGAMAGYLISLGYYAYVSVGYSRYYSVTALQVPRTQQVIFLLALGAAGLLAGQIVRQARRMADGYPVSAAPEQEA